MWNFHFAFVTLLISYPCVSLSRYPSGRMTKGLEPVQKILHCDVSLTTFSVIRVGKKEHVGRAGRAGLGKRGEINKS
ncbi:hypothetical protein F4803DRAFT_506021 [Xylaria telfairii]|nr:hypothetical protein F4803DRAFT_506021 [Xylaria telfairii]